ncbi:hypothetical protein FLACHUCJ7_04602 [Flavobacterium chungangense]|uniref:Uncharacterized protein n=1 Tax=Flavobacterium chungangense TaxID=554283 RepID=A0A6V6ZG92_9FLAO|nr:hypothetical protein FLACHUCJ7_04602 [Flavobacterium chungangense]
MLQSSDNLPEIGCIYECLFRSYTLKNNQKKDYKVSKNIQLPLLLLNKEWEHYGDLGKLIIKLFTSEAIYMLSLLHFTGTAYNSALTLCRSAQSGLAVGSSFIFVYILLFHFLSFGLNTYHHNILYGHRSSAFLHF